MAHVRQQIRDAVVAALTALPAISGRVEASRTYTAQRAPYVIVYTGNEEAESDVIGRPGYSLRTCYVTVEIYSDAGSGEFDDEIDSITVQIEQALANDPATFPMAKSWQYAGLSMDYSKDGKNAGGVATLEYQFIYRVREDDPEIGV